MFETMRIMWQRSQLQAWHPVKPVVLPESDTPPTTPSVRDKLKVPKSPLAAPTQTPIKTSPLRTRSVRKKARPGYLKDYLCEGQGVVLNKRTNSFWSSCFNFHEEFIDELPVISEGRNVVMGIFPWSPDIFTSYWINWCMMDSLTTGHHNHHSK